MNLFSRKKKESKGTVVISLCLLRTVKSDARDKLEKYLDSGVFSQRKLMKEA
mgnify:FL=1